MHTPGGQFRSSLIALATLLAAGCTTLRPAETQLRPIGNRPPSFNSAAISYRMPAAASQNVDPVQPASYSPQPPSAARIQILSVQYPHPAGKQGFALAEVIVARDPSTAADKRSGDWLAGFRRLARDRMPGITYAEGIESASALDVPIVEVDQLIARLDAQGYFSDKNRPAAGAELSASINGLSFSKPWQSVPEISALVGRVRREGKLVSHRQPLDLPALQSTPHVTAAPVALASATTAPVVPPLAAPSPASASPVAASPVAVSPVMTAVYSAPAEGFAPGQCERLPPVE